MQDEFLNAMRDFMQNLHDGLPIPPPGEEKEPEATTDTELSSTKDIQPLPVHESPQDSDIRQLIEESGIKVYEEQKLKMENTMIEDCHQKEILCIHDNVDDLPESSLNSKLLSINSQQDKRECDVPISENSPVCDNHSDIFYDSNNDDDISVYDDFEDVEYVDASLPDPEIASEEEENAQQEEEEVDFEDISQIQDIVLREKLLSITRLISNIKSLKDNSTPDRVLNSFESDNSLLDNFSPEFETFCDHSEEMRSGNTTHADNSLPEYDSFCFKVEPDQERLINLVKNDILDNSSNDLLLDEADLFLASDSSIPPGIENENPSIPRPPPKPPDAEINAGEEIPVVMNNKIDFYSFMIDKVFSLLSAESEDTIFDLGSTPSD
nr:hypothetical protein [Tanacetum cinerariifolium]